MILFHFIENDCLKTIMVALDVNKMYLLTNSKNFPNDKRLTAIVIKDLFVQ